MKKITSLSFVICFYFSLNAQNLIQIPQDAATLNAAVQLAQPGDTILLSAGIYTDSVHILYKNLIFKGDPNGGSVLSPGINEKSFVLLGSEVEFIQLEFDDFQQNSPPPNFAITATNSNIKIKQCEFTNFYSPISLFEGNLEISNSIFSGTRGNANIMHNIGVFLMYNNLIYGIDKTAISINRAHGHFFNNTLIGSTPTRHYGVIINSDSISHFYNNIFDGFGIGIQQTATDSFELSSLRIYNNNIHNAAAPYWYEYNENLSFPIFSGPLSPNPGTGEISVPTIFVNPANGNFSLQASSPCIDAGLNAFPFPVHIDLNGNNRVFGASPDIGAYEYVISTELNKEDFQPANVDVEIYPQPTKDYVWVRFKESYSGKIEILDISGNVIGKMEIMDTKKFMVDLPEHGGIFFLRITRNDIIQIERVLKFD